MSTVWIDTNTALEVYSHGDIYDAGDRGDLVKLERRRLQMQGSLWMAMGLCSQLAKTETFEHENLRNILRMAPPDSSRGAWTSVVLYILVDGSVFDGWDGRMAKDGAQLSNPARDRFMIAQCRNRGMTLISRDEDALEIARNEGVDAVRPEEYGARILSWDAAREMFMRRLRAAVDSYPMRHPPELRDEKASAAHVCYEVYEWVWMLAGSAE